MTGDDLERILTAIERDEHGARVRLQRVLLDGRAQPSAFVAQSAVATIRATADRLREASGALLKAAEHMNRAGLGVHARHAYEAGKRAAEAADGLVHA